MKVDILSPQDAEDYAELRRASLLDSPLAFASSPDDDIVSSAEAVREQLRRAPNSVIFGAFHPGLVGSVGLSPPHGPSHRIEVAR